MGGFNEKIICPICGKESSKVNMWRHQRWHLNNPDKLYRKEYVSLNHDGLNCQYCGKLCKSRNSLAQHEIRCKENPNRLNYFINKESCNIPLEKRGYGKGLTKETDPRRARNAASIKEYYKNHEAAFKGKHHTEETKEKLRQSQLNIDHSYANRYLWSKKGYFDNIFFMSTWELAYYIYMKDQGNKLKRCSNRYEYFYKEKKHYYTPDFVLNDKYIIEVKGKETEIDKIKYSSVDNLKIIYYDQIKDMIYYCLKKYNIKKLSLLYD